MEAILVTPPAVGAIAVIVLRGAGARTAVEKLAGRTIDGAVKRVKFSRAGDVIDDGLVLAIGENEFELHLHGGVAVIEAIFAALTELGVKRAAAISARNLADEIAAILPLALTETGVRLLSLQSANWQTWIERVAKLDESWRAASEIQWRLERSRSLMRLIRPARVAIVGPPNAGKSTLANFLLGRRAAITSDIAGTTRDWVDGLATIVGGSVSAPVTLVDTAGIRETGDEIERESIRRTHQQVEIADIVLAVFDCAAGVDESVLRKLPINRILVANKMDLTKQELKGAIGISARNGESIDRLMADILRRLDLSAVDFDEPFAFTQRQRLLLEQAAMAGTTQEISKLLRGVLDFQIENAAQA